MWWCKLNQSQLYPWIKQLNQQLLGKTFFSLVLEPTSVGLSHFAMAVSCCHPCAVAMLWLVHATTYQTSKILKSTAVIVQVCVELVITKQHQTTHKPKAIQKPSAVTF